MKKPDGSRKKNTAHGKKEPRSVTVHARQTIGKPGQILVQVKSGHVKSGDVRDLVGTVEGEKAAMGLFITLEPPRKDIETEAATTGIYHSTHWGDFPRVQIHTIEQLLHGQTFKTPPPLGTFKQAAKVETGKQGEQGELDLDA